MAVSNTFKYKYTLLLLFSAFMGANILAFRAGIQWSLYRFLLIISLFFIVFEKGVSRTIQKSSGRVYYNFLLFWIIYSILLLVFVEDYIAFFRCFLFLLSALVACVVVSCNINDKNKLDNSLRVFEIAALLLSLIGGYEIVTGNYMFVTQETNDYYNMNILLESTLGIRVPISVFRNPNDFSIFLLFAYFTSYYLTRVKKNNFDRWFSRVLVLWFFFMVLATQSRASFAAILLGTAIILLDRFKELSVAKRTIIIVVVIASLSSVVAWLLANSELYEALIAFDPDDTGGSDYVRMLLIKNGFKMYGDSFGLGVGLGNIECHMAKMPDETAYIKNIHNWWMELLVSSGPFVFIYYLHIYIKSLFYHWKKIKNKVIPREDHYLSLTFFIILLTYSFACITSSSVMSSEWLWVYFALIFVAPTCLKNNENLSRNQPSSSK